MILSLLCGKLCVCGGVGGGGWGGGRGGVGGVILNCVLVEQLYCIM